MSYSLKKLIAFSIISLFTLTTLFIQLNNDIEKREIEELTDNTPTYYTVKEYDGKVTIFRNEDTQPLNIYDSYVSVLPQSDQEKLKSGITVSNTDDLQKVIEDYTS